MTLFELQAWLGHRSPASTQHYAQITPTTLTKAYTDAGYFARNLRTIAVLVDREAFVSGAAADGVRTLRLLRPESIDEGAARRGKRQPPAHVGRDPAHGG